MKIFANVFNQSLRKNIIITFLCIIGLSFLVSCSGKEAKSNNTVSKDVNKEAYTVLKKDDISVDDVKRYVYTVIVNTEASKKDLEEIANKIVDKAKGEGNFNAIQILMYDGEYAVAGEMVPSLGKYTYAPEGDFSKAMDIKSGEYDKMKPLDELKEVNWKLRPSEKDRKIIAMYNELFKQASEENTDSVIKDDDIRAKAAELMDISVENINDALGKLDEWIWQE